MNTIEKLGDEETFISIVERTITEFEDNEIELLGNHVFLRCYELTSVSLPAATSVGDSAFYYCSNLTNVDFPAATSIGDQAFYNCTSLTNANFPAATSIGDQAFYNCTSLTNANFPLATSIRSQSFYSCSSLTSVDFPAATSIEDQAFKDCTSIKTVNLPEVKTVSDLCFNGCNSIESISMPKVTSIGYNFIVSCHKITALSFPELVTLGDRSASNSVIINCDSLKEINFPKLVNFYGGIYGCDALEEISLPKVESLKSSQMFSNCIALKSISLPSIKSLADGFVYDNCTAFTTLYIGTESDTVCTLSGTSYLPSSISTIYVPYNLQEQYRTATNWSSLADKIIAYEEPIACQSLTITAEDVPGYKTTTKIHYEAVCTYSCEGVMQTGTKVFKGDAVSDTFSTNPSGESSRQVEVSYTFLGKTATTTITQDKYLGNPVGGKIYYIDDTADGTYSFYDADGNLMSDVSVGSTPTYYKVLTAGSKDKYYVYHDELYDSLRWTYYKNGSSVTTSLRTGTAIGTGKSNTATVLAADGGAYITADSNGYPTIWYKLQQIRNASTGGCSDWFIPSKDEVEEVRLAIGCTTSTSGAVVVDAGAVTGGTIAGTADGQTHYRSAYGTYYCYPSNTKFLTSSIWSSSNNSANSSWAWGWSPYSQNWGESYSKSNYNSVFFVRAF